MIKQLTTHDVFQAMERWAPKTLAYEWDNVGMQIGDAQKKIHKVMVTLDVIESVVDEAITQHVDLIIAHHPLLFKPVHQLNVNSPKGRVIQKLIHHDISVYAAHTNLDLATGGVNDMLCNVLGIQERDVLVEEGHESLTKVCVYVPDSHADNVRQAMTDAGAGHIGAYSHCTFTANGTGRFMPEEGTNPFIGDIHNLAKADETKIETIVPESRLTGVLEQMIKHHPYEEPAYDVYPLENNGAPFGIGRIGKPKEQMSVEAYCEHIKQALDVPCVRVAGDLTHTVNKVAILGGSGEKYTEIAKKQGADVYITGDITFHAAQDAWQMGLSIIDPGHHVEKVMKQAVKAYLENQFKANQIKVMVSHANTEPFQFI